MSALLKNHYKSHLTELNVYHHYKPVETGTKYYYTPDIDDGYIYNQLFICTKSLVSYLYGMKTEKIFLNTLEDNIHAFGEISILISDRAQYEFINHAQNILWELFIDDWKIEPHYQHQKFSEHGYNTFKHLTNNIIVRTGDPAYMWLLVLVCVCFLFNHTHYSEIKGIPITKATSSTSDISPLLCFYFWQPVYYKVDYSDLLSYSTEKCGCWVGIAEYAGRPMPFKVLNYGTQKIIFCSNLCSAEKSTESNPGIDPLCEETYSFVKSCPYRNKQNVLKNLGRLMHPK